MQNRNGLTDTENKQVVIKGERKRQKGKLHLWDPEIETTIYKTDKQ